jgi:chromosome segregation ATPase
MQYRLRTLLVLLSTGLPGLAVYAQKAPITDAQKGRMTTYYEQLLLQGVHPLEAQMKDNLLHTRLIWDRPKQAFQRLDELEKELDTIQSDADSVRQAIARARNLIHEERTALEVNSTPLEDWAKRLDESPNDAATMSKYVRKAKDLFGVRGNARANAYSAKALAQVQAQLAKWEQQVMDEDVKQRYAAAKAELARIERAIGPRAESRDSK